MKNLFNKKPMTMKERNEAQLVKNIMESDHIKTMVASLKFLETKLGMQGLSDALMNTSGKYDFSEGGNISLKGAKRRFEEADSTSGFTQFLRAGVQQLLTDGYINSERTYTDWATVVPSKKASELYAPNHGVAFPRQVGEDEIYPEVGAAALDLQLKNNKYGSMMSVTKEMIDDDQTASFSQNASQLGEYLAILEEVLCYGKLASAANMSYGGYNIPQSETKPSYEAGPYPWATPAAPLRGGGVTRFAAHQAFGQVALQSARNQLRHQKNLQGLLMAVQGRRVIIGTKNEYDASVLLNSSYYPSGAAVAGATGGAFSNNPLKGLFDLTVATYMFDQNGQVTADSKAWYVADAKKPWFILQQREGANVVQEAPNSGASFEKDVMRFKGSERMNADFVDPRFAFQGSDGSV